MYTISAERRDATGKCSVLGTGPEQQGDFMLQELLRRKDTIFKRLLLRQSWAAPDLL